MLKWLALYNNSLTGHLPSEVGRLTMLLCLWLDTNEFNGTVPSELALFTSLSYLFLYNTSITGAVPQYVCAAVNGSIPYSPPLKCNFFIWIY